MVSRANILACTYSCKEYDRKCRHTSFEAGENFSKAEDLNSIRINEIKSNLEVLNTACGNYLQYEDVQVEMSGERGDDVRVLPLPRLAVIAACLPFENCS